MSIKSKDNLLFFVDNYASSDKKKTAAKNSI